MFCFPKNEPIGPKKRGRILVLDCIKDLN